MSVTFYSIENNEGEIYVGHHLAEFLDVKRFDKKAAKFLGGGDRENWIVEQIASYNTTFSWAMVLMKRYYTHALDAVNKGE